MARRSSFAERVSADEIGAMRIHYERAFERINRVSR
jgi:hypothetical protein